MSCPFLLCSPLEKKTHSQEELNEKWQFRPGLKCTDTLSSLHLLSVLCSECADGAPSQVGAVPQHSSPSHRRNPTPCPSPHTHPKLDI